MTTDKSSPAGNLTDTDELLANQASIKQVRQDLAEAAFKALTRDKRYDYIEIVLEDCDTCSAYSQNKIAAWESGAPKRLYFSIADAADIAKLNPNDLLVSGGAGAIILCTPLPPSLNAFPFHAGSAGQLIELPELLALSDSDCRQIELNGFTEQCDFEKGYVFSNSEIACVFPGYRNFDYMYKDATWRTFKGNTVNSMVIQRDQLYVTRTSLCQLLDSRLAMPQENVKIEPASATDLKVEEPSIKRKPKQKRMDTLALEYDPMLRADPSLTASKLMKQLIGQIGKPNTCIVIDMGVGLKWERQNGETEELNIKQLESRISRWKKANKPRA